jgi:hypothetical protein
MAPKAGSAQHGRVQQGELPGIEVPVQLDQRGRDPDDEQVVGVGEEPHPRDQDRAQVESAQRSVVEGR